MSIKTSICDRNPGQLRWFGHDAIPLVRSSTWPEVIGLFCHRRLPTPKETNQIAGLLDKQPRRLSESEKDSLSFHRSQHLLPCQMLQVMFAEKENKIDRLENYDVINTLWDAVMYLGFSKNGKEAESPAGLLSTHLYNMTGTAPKETQTEGLSRMMMLAADAGVNVSALAVRIGAAGRIGFHPALSLALGSWSSPFHGGASSETSRLIDILMSMNEAEITGYIEDNYLIPKQRLFGFGHKVHKRGEDPRIEVFNQINSAMFPGDSKVQFVMDNISKIAAKYNLFPNPELMVGAIAYQLGLPADYMPATIALGRIIGWSAHYNEQRDQRILDNILPEVSCDDRNYLP